MSSLKDIFNFQKIEEKLTTSGQPTKEQLTYIASLGYQLIINIRTHEEMNELFNEEEFVKSLGIDYIQINMSLEEPNQKSFNEFCNLLNSNIRKKIHVHCKANKRVSAFTAAYLLKFRSYNLTEAEKIISNVWNPPKYWLDFLKNQL